MVRTFPSPDLGRFLFDVADMRDLIVCEGMRGAMSGG
jgi:hypothetical protein